MKQVNKMELEESYAKAFVALKNATMVANFYKTQLQKYMEDNGKNFAEAELSDGTSVTVNYVPQSTEKRFSQEKALSKLQELLGDSFNKNDYYNTNSKDSYVKVNVNFPTEEDEAQ